MKILAPRAQCLFLVGLVCLHLHLHLHRNHDVAPSVANPFEPVLLHSMML